MLLLQHFGEKPKEHGSFSKYLFISLCYSETVVIKSIVTMLDDCFCIMVHQPSLWISLWTLSTLYMIETRRTAYFYPMKKESVTYREDFLLQIITRANIVEQLQMNKNLIDLDSSQAWIRLIIIFIMNKSWSQSRKYSSQSIYRILMTL